MKLELILPRKDPGKLVDLGIYLKPLTLTQLAACVPDDIELRVTDENLTTADPSWLPDVVGISVMTSQVGRATELSREYRKNGAAVFWGGVHPTIVDQSDNPVIDSFFVGEAESTLPQALDDFQEGNLMQRYENIMVSDLDVLPLPRRDILDASVDQLIDVVIASRGCKYNCIFCSASKVYGNLVRWASPDYLAQDLSQVEGEYIFFADDNFTNLPRYTKGIIDRIKGFGKKLLVQIDAKSALEMSVVEMLAEADTKAALVGFESVNPENFHGNRKYVPPTEWGKIADNLHKHGIAVYGEFIIGFDSDRFDVYQRTHDAIIRSGIDGAGFSILTPYPGTGLYDLMRDRILDHDFSHYDLHHAVFDPHHMTPNELEQITADLNHSQKPMFQLLKELDS